MRLQNLVVFAALAFLVLVMPIVTSTVLAYNKKGPTPIPGDLIPFPGEPKHTKIHHVAQINTAKQ